MGNMNNKGRGREPRHVRLYHSVTGCEAWRDLSGNAVKLLIALARLDTGKDNGSIFLSARDGAEMIGVTPGTASKAFRELEDHGFIAATSRGHFSQKGGPATTWRMTWVAAPGCRPAAPTRDFEKWQKPAPAVERFKTRCQKSSGTVSKIDTADETGGAMVLKSDTADAGTSLVPVKRGVSKIDTQVVLPRSAGKAGRSDRLKHTSANSNSETGSLADLRQQTVDYLARMGIGAQSRLAHSAKIPPATLSRFLNGGTLPREHVVQLVFYLNARAKAAA